MKRVADDPSSPSCTNTEPAGLYVFAPDNTQLNQAFARAASEILRISQSPGKGSSRFWYPELVPLCYDRNCSLPALPLYGESRTPAGLGYATLR